MVSPGEVGLEQAPSAAEMATVIASIHAGDRGELFEERT
jgi:hypothetical protein